MEFKQRIEKLQRLLAREPRHTVALISSAPQMIRSHDVSYPYRQDSNFLYLTGWKQKNAVLVVDPLASRPVLISAVIPQRGLAYHTEVESTESIAQQIGATPITTSDPHLELRALLQRAEILAVDNRRRSIGWEFLSRTMDVPRISYHPGIFGWIALDQFMAQLRLYKSAHELQLMARAHAITRGAIEAVLPYVCGGKVSEREIAAALHYALSSDDEPGFTPIVASGAHGGILHHTAGPRVIKKNELIIVDCGAEYQGYVADLCRTLPVGGQFTDATRALYDVVAEAYQATTSALRPGRTCEEIFLVERRALIRGLKKHRLLSGSVDTLLKQPHIPHLMSYAGHTIGMDAHDPGKCYIHRSAVELEAGMTLAIEPGLYLPHATGKFPALGIRIEDEFMITSRGARPIGNHLPTDADEIELLVQGLGG